MTDRTSFGTLSVIFLLCILIFSISIPLRYSGSLIRSDGIGYYSYLRSLVFDKDVNHYNEFKQFNEISEVTKTDYVRNQWSIGPAILWLPFYLIAYIISNFCLAYQGSGYELIYQIAVCIATIVYVFIGAILSYLSCRRYFSASISFLSVIGIWLAGNTIYYTIIEPSMSQGVQFFAAAVFLYTWTAPIIRYGDFIKIGFALGLMVLVHWQNLTFVGVFIGEILYFLWAARNKDSQFIPAKYLKRFLFIIPPMFLMYIPQMLAWKKMLGAFIASPRGPGQLKLSHPQLLSYLFSPGNSIAWTPILFLALWGFVYLYHKDKRLAVSLLCVLVLQLYFYSCTGYMLGSYGPRHLVSSSPIFMLSLGALIKHTKQRFGWYTISFVIAALMIWNALFIAQYTLKFIPHDGSTSMHGFFFGKVDLVKYLFFKNNI